MREKLAVALARHIGELLTPELAREIGREAVTLYDTSIDPWQFAPERQGMYVFQCERLMDGGQDLRQQRSNYLYETGDGAPIRTDWARLIRQSREGTQVIFTARDEATNLLGSVWLLIGEDCDTRRKSVTDDILYIEPTHRVGMLGLNLVKYAERCIFALGVREATFHFRLENGADRMARFLGYRAISTRVKKSHNGDSFADVPTRHTGDFNGSVA